MKSPVESVLIREVEIEPNVKLECVPTWCRLRWFEHLERKGGDDWVSASTKVEEAEQEDLERVYK